MLAELATTGWVNLTYMILGLATACLVGGVLAAAIYDAILPTSGRHRGV